MVKRSGNASLGSCFAGSDKKGDSQDQGNSFALIPMQSVGPIKIVSSEVNDEITVPLATFEKPVCLAVNRGAKISRLAAGIRVEVIKDCMTRSVVVEADNVAYLLQVVTALASRFSEMAGEVSRTSRFAVLQDWQQQIVGNLLYLRFSLETKDAAGHNMVTKAADALLIWLIAQYPGLRYVSVSGNYCVDKKPSAVNGILGRGKYVVAEIVVPAEICKKYLRATPAAIVELNIKKNLIGSILAGSIRTANAHFANMLLAFYLATGQDAANIVEGSQGIVTASVRDNDLYFAVTIPNIIIGACGSGKNSAFVEKNLAMLGCLPNGKVGKSAKKLAVIAAATVLCGELSLLAAQVNPGELMRVHLSLER